MPEPKIDLHSHWFSPSVTRLLSERRQGVRIEPAQAGRASLVRGVDDGLPARFDLGPQWFDLDLRLEHLDSVGIVHQLLSWPTTLGVDPLSAPGEALELWQAYNKDLGQLVREHPTRFSAVAALSTSDIGWSVDELARAHEQWGLIGAVLPVNVFASSEAAAHIRPLLVEAQKHRSHLYLHTGNGHASISGQPSAPDLRDIGAVRSAVATASGFANAVFTLLFTDLLDEFPDVTVQFAMLGGSGTFANLLEQFLAAPERYGAIDIGKRLARLTFDTGAAGRGTEAITHVARVLGHQQVVFGTDYAPSADTREVIDNIRRTPLDAAAQRDIFFHNPARLLRSKGVTLTDLI